MTLNKIKDLLEAKLHFFDSEKKRTWLVYAWLVLISLLSYGLLIPWLGFYWDAIPYLYQYRTFGAAGFPAFVASDRPFSAWIFMLTTSLFNYNPLGYHLVALVIRVLCSLFFYKILQLVYADRHDVQLAAASLFAVYPGFLQQPVAYIYIHHLSTLVFFLISVYLMLRAFSQARVNTLLLFLSMLCALSMFYLENFALLELARPFVIWKFLHDRKIKAPLKAGHILIRWLPFALLFVTFLYWRVFVLQFSSYQPSFLDALADNWRSAVWGLVRRLPQDFYTATLKGWVNTLSAFSSDQLGSSALLVYVSLVLGVFVLALLVQVLWDSFYRKEYGSRQQLTFLHGLLLFFLAGGIVWVLEFPLDTDFPLDRMLLAFIPATALLLSGGYVLLTRWRWLRRMALAFLVALAVGGHFENAMGYRQEWKSLHAFMWELKWRIPELWEDTMLVTNDLPLRYFSDNSLSFAFNWMHEVPKGSYDLPYLLLFSEARLGGSLEALEPHVDVSKNYRKFNFNGSTDRMILFYHDPPGCVHVLDPELDRHNPLVPAEIIEAVSLSRLDLIRDDHAAPVAWEILESPYYGWCYYFQKASLAVQNQDWETAAQLGDSAFSLDEYPNDASERLPFIEAYAMTGQWDKALQYSTLTIEVSELYQPMLCALWQRIDANMADSAEKTRAIDEIFGLAGCQPGG